MDENFEAFAVSPCPLPDRMAVAPPLYRGISTACPCSSPSRPPADCRHPWTSGRGASVSSSCSRSPGRWSSSTMGLPGRAALVGEKSSSAPPASVSFACVLDEIDTVVSSVRALGTVPECARPRGTTRDVEVITPREGAVVFTPRPRCSTRRPSKAATCSRWGSGATTMGPMSEQGMPVGETARSARFSPWRTLHHWTRSVSRARPHARAPAIGSTRTRTSSASAASWSTASSVSTWMPSAR